MDGHMNGGGQGGLTPNGTVARLQHPCPWISVLLFLLVDVRSITRKRGGFFINFFLLLFFPFSLGRTIYDGSVYFRNVLNLMNSTCKSLSLGYHVVWWKFSSLSISACDLE